ncbi:MAG: HNH endonuclease [Ardenticatenaceae bacterium]
MTRKYIPAEVKHRVRKEAQHRCGYCLARQEYIYDLLQIEHIIPLSKGGTNDEWNFWLACHRCNGHKSDKTSQIDPQTGEEVPLFNPRTQNWWAHFRWSEDGIRIVGLTPIGRATVIALHLDSDPITLAVRANWVQVGWHPPKK